MKKHIFLQGRKFATATNMPFVPKHVPILILGAGTGGISVAHQLINLFKDNGKPLKSGAIAIVDGGKIHHYQPGYTLVGSGLARSKDVQKPISNFIPVNTHFVNSDVANIKPDVNEVNLINGQSIKYDTLILSTGIQIKPKLVPGLEEALKAKQVFSSYYFDTADEIYPTIKALKSGNAHFTMPAGPVKCAGGPQKIMWMAEDYWRRHGLKGEINTYYHSPLAGMFGAAYYNEPLLKLAKERAINTQYNQNLCAVDGSKREASFENTVTKEMSTLKYDFLHAVPPMRPPEFIKSSGLADPSGFVDVDKETLRSTKYDNVWSLGDSSNIPTSKTAAAVFAQAPVVVNNIFQAINFGHIPNAKYDGYTGCPLLIENGKVLLAEFKYNGVPAGSFSKFYDQRNPSTFAWILKTRFFPYVYWNQALKGHWYGSNHFIRPAYKPAKVITSTS